jgi:hypothetical protein
MVSDLMTHPDLTGLWKGLDEIPVTALESEGRPGRLESILEELPTELIVTLSERTRLQDALNAVAGVGPILDDPAPATLGLEQSITRIRDLPPVSLPCPKSPPGPWSPHRPTPTTPSPLNSSRFPQNHQGLVPASKFLSHFLDESRSPRRGIGAW